MSKKIEKILGMMMVLMMIITILPIGIVQAAPAENVTVNLHKMILEDGATSFPDITNTGKIIDKGTLKNLKAYKPSEYGTIEFSVYKIDKSKLDGIKETPQEIANKFTEKALEETTLPYEATKVGKPVAVNEDGIATFTLEQTKEAGYVFVETKKPANVTEGAKPMFVWLPLTKEDGSGYETEVHLYPKNKAEKLSVDLIKYFQATGKDKEAVVKKDFSFDLYKGNPADLVVTNEKGEIKVDLGSKVVKVNKNPLVTNADGKITVSDLTVGDYFFAETAVPKSGDAMRAVINQETGLRTSNKLTFKYTSDGAITYPEDSLLNNGKKVINYEKPSIVKAVDKETGSTAKNEFKFTLTNITPADIASYKTYKIVDIPGKDMEISQDTVKITIDGVEEKGLNPTFTAHEFGENGVTYKSDKALVIDFPQDKIKTLKPNTPITVTYSASLKPSAKMGERQINLAVLSGHNGYQDGDSVSKKEVRTFGHKLYKTGRGLFGTQVGSPALEGVEFKVKNEAGKWLKYVDERVTFVDTEAEAEAFTTNKDGIIELKGLDLGKYTAVEIKTAPGYRLPVNPETVFTVTEFDDATKIGQTEIKNVKSPDLPHTGLYYSDIFASLIMLLIAGGTAAYVIDRKKKLNKIN